MSNDVGNISENSISTEAAPSTSDLLSKVTIAGLTEENYRDTLKEAVTILAEYLQADNAYVLLKDQQGQLENVATIHLNNQDETSITASDNLIAKVMENADGILVLNAMNNEQFGQDPAFQRFNINSAICMPVKTDQKTLGVIYLDSRTDRQWNDEHQSIIQLAAIHFALAISCMQWKKEAKDNERLAASGKATLQLSHSVKNILQMVGGAAEVIDFGLKTNQIHRVKRSWDILKPNIERLKKFTLDMLDFSKERHLELGPCNFNRVIQGAIESLKSQLKQKKSKLNIRIDQNIPTVELDSERIHEMALNLILNAIDIVDESTGLVSVETNYLPNEQAVQLSITDNGPGMTEEMKEKIFTPFESGKNKFGTGLGMPIAKQIIDQHNGKIEIDTKQGQGTTFRVTLPSKVLDQQADES